MAGNASSLGRPTSVPSTMPESGEKANEELEKPINARKTRAVNSCPKGNWLSLETSSFSDTLLRACISAPNFVLFAGLQNPKPKFSLSFL